MDAGHKHEDNIIQAVYVQEPLAVVNKPTAMVWCHGCRAMTQPAGQKTTTPVAYGPDSTL